MVPWAQPGVIPKHRVLSTVGYDPSKKKEKKRGNSTDKNKTLNTNITKVTRKVGMVGVKDTETSRIMVKGCWSFGGWHDHDITFEEM